MRRLLCLAGLVAAGCLPTDQLPPEEQCPATSSRVLQVRAGTYLDTGAVEPTVPDGGVGDGGTVGPDTDYALEISEDRRTVTETYIRGRKRYTVTYRAAVVIKR
ncbi:MAG: hypothetical protein ACK4N5_11915 [Myxococcales bacterium]